MAIWCSAKAANRSGLTQALAPPKDAWLNKAVLGSARLLTRFQTQVHEPLCLFRLVPRAILRCYDPRSWRHRVWSHAAALTIHSSRHRFAARLNSGVSATSCSVLAVELRNACVACSLAHKLGHLATDSVQPRTAALRLCTKFT